MKQYVRFQGKMQHKINQLDQIRKGRLSAIIYLKILMPDIW